MLNQTFRKKLSMLLCIIMVACFTLFGMHLTVSAATTYLADGNSTTIQNAINNAVAGDTLVIPSGTFTLSSTVTINKSLILKGAGMASTTLNGATTTYIKISANNVRIEDIKFKGRTSSSYSSDVAISIGNYLDFVILKCEFRDVSYRGILTNGNDTRGVVSYCNFYNTWNGTGVVVYGVGSTNWDRPLSLGTQDAVFIEDCYFNGGRHAIASNQGAKYVFRHNEVYNTNGTEQAMDAHGLEYGSTRGTRSYEIYENYTHNDAVHYCGAWIRGGDGVIFNNNFNNATYAILLSDTTGTPHSTYPAPDQTRSLYVWGNTLNGNAAGVKVADGQTHLFQQNRDYFLYQKLNYTPYTYPHPLVSGITPPPTPPPPTPTPTPTPAPTSTPGYWDSKVSFGEGTHVIGAGNTGTQLVEFDFIPHYNLRDGVVGFAGYNTTITDYPSFSLMLRSNSSGYFDAYNNTGYQAANTIPYSANSTYHVKMIVNLDANTYNAWITPPGGNETALANTYGFRAATANIDDLGKVCVRSYNNNDFTISNFSISEYVDSDTWNSRVDFAAGTHVIGVENTGTQQVEFNFTPHYNLRDGVVGFAGYNTIITGYPSFSLMVRSNSSGYFDAYNNTGYQAANTIPYSANSTYHIRMVVNLYTNTYNVWVTPPGGNETLLADNYAFRSGTSNIDDLGKVCARSYNDNDFTVTSFSIGSYLESWDSKVSFTDGTHVLGASNTGTQLVNFDFTPRFNSRDGVVGFAGYNTTITDYASFSLMVRSNNIGYFDAYNSTGYQAVSSIPYNANTTYHIRMIVNLDTNTYNAWVTAPGGSETLLADNYAFRAATPNIDDLGKVCLRSYNDNDFNVSNFYMSSCWDSKVSFSSGAHVLGSANTGTQVVNFDFTPFFSTRDGVVGFAGYNTTITDYTSFSLMVRSNSSGYFDAYNNTGYQSANSIPYSADRTYHVRMIINLVSNTYNAWITPPGGTETQLANNYAFRAATPNIDDLGKVCARSYNDNDFNVSNFAINAQ